MNWKPEFTSNFGKVPLQIEHNLHRHPLFSDDALAVLLQGVDRSDYYVNTMDVTSQNLRSRREGEIRNLAGKDILEAVKTGRIWILVMRPEKVVPEYGRLLKDIYGELAETLPGYRPSYESMTILISSPSIQVYYHCDLPEQTLWQVRGHKTVYVYPNTAPFLEQAALEKIVLGEAHEISLRYEPDFDAHATVFDLQPGQMLHWPLNAPHRVSNGNCLNVSFTTENFTRNSRRLHNVNFANGILRNRLGTQTLRQNIDGPAYWGKLGVVAAYKAAGLHRKRRRRLAVDFQVDPNSPFGVRNIAGYQY